MASSIGFFNPTIGNAANIAIVGSVLAGACLLQQVARSIFVEKAQEASPLKEYTIVILTGASGLIGLVVGASLLKCAALALAAFALLSLIEHVQNKKPDQPDNTGGKNASPQTSKSASKKGDSSPLTPRASPDPANDKAQDSEEGPPPPSPFSVPESEEERFKIALKDFKPGQTVPTAEPRDESSGPAAPPHTPPKKPLFKKGTSSSPPPKSSPKKWPDPLKPVPPISTERPLAQDSAATSTSIASSLPNPVSNEVMTEVNGFFISESAMKDLEKLQSLNGLLSSDLGEEEYVETEDAGPAVAAVVNASPPKKSTLEHLFDEFLSTEETFIEEMTDYSVKLELMKQTKLLTAKEYTTITQGLDILLETSAELIKSFQEQGPFATYSNDALIDKYYDALTSLTINNSSASAILRKAIEGKSCKKTYGDLWDKAILPVQRGPRHPLLVASAIKEDTSFIPLQQKLEYKAQKINNSILLGQYNSLDCAIKEISGSKELKFESWDNLGCISYRVIPRKNKGQPSDAAGVENDKSVPVIEETLDFLIRIAKALNDPKLKIGLETINKEQINALFTMLQKHEWYTKAEVGKKRFKLKRESNEIASKAQELKTILGIQ